LKTGPTLDCSRISD